MWAAMESVGQNGAGLTFERWDGPEDAITPLWTGG